MIGKLTLMSLILALGTSAVHAQAQYPDKPVKIVVPVAAGGGVDVMARLLALNSPSASARNLWWKTAPAPPE